MPETESLTTGTQSLVSNLTANGWQGALKLVILAVVLFIVCMIIKSVILKILDKGLSKSTKIEKSFHTFIRSAVNIVLWFVTAMIVCQSLGINLTVLVALVSIIGLALSLSVQDALANLAGGVTILATQPFKVGDFIEVGGTTGTVEEIGMVHTKLNTLDNRRVILPNGTVIGSEVQNYSTLPQRRVDLSVSAPFNMSIQQVNETIEAVMNAHPKVLKTPAPFVRAEKFGEKGMDYTVRAWCQNADYWDVYFDLTQQIKEAFDQAGIAVPCGKMAVEVQNAGN